MRPSRTAASGAITFHSTITTSPALTYDPYSNALNLTFAGSLPDSWGLFMSGINPIYANATAFIPGGNTYAQWPSGGTLFIRGFDADLNPATGSSNTVDTSVTITPSVAPVLTFTPGDEGHLDWSFAPGVPDSWGFFHPSGDYDFDDALYVISGSSYTYNDTNIGVIIIVGFDNNGLAVTLPSNSVNTGD